ncbi:uncharacterized protein LOC126696117 [Quercus robur]|uniref:uncharacterized protein LOC126696117 n=1 Tax=Quercus robur TaxID=38942 RepID=UPI00216194DF|nr:uncharacterized protein LOC126696117 [Quercus robur]
MGLPEDSELRESLMRRPLEDIRQLMGRIEEYKRLEVDRLQSKGKASIGNRPRQSGFQPRPRKDLRIQEPELQLGEVNVTFKAPIHRIVDRIKNEPYFKFPNKMGGDPSRRNQNLYCTYHRDKGHIIEQRQEFVADTGNKDAEQGTQQRGNPLPPPLGVIEVIHAAPRGTAMAGRRGVLIVVPVENSSGKQPPEKKLKLVREPITFNDDDLEGTIQPHDDALVVIAWIKGFIVKRVMVDQGSGADLMYSDLFRGLRLKKEDLLKYDTPLVGFDGQVVILEG